jgi:lysozyme
MIHVSGIDVSDYQPGVDWKQVHDAGYSFAYTKATEGTDFVAATFESNMAGMKAAGKLRGAYHFFHFDGTAIAQAQAFLAAYTPEAGDLPPALDLEAALPPGGTAAEAVKSIGTWLDYVEDVTKRPCVLYMGYYFWRDTLDSPDFSGHPLWIAEYTDEKDPASLTLPSPPWKTWTFWQYTDAADVPGAGQVDGDYFNGDLNALKGLCLP